MMVATRSNKRQRQITTVTQISDFPDVILSNISSYLTETSSLKLCLATSKQEPDLSISKAIMKEHYHLWDSIDFNEMKELFGGDITDDNMRWLLICTDAVHNLRRLKLTNCVGIIGVGLQPLMGSTVLESIDLSLVSANESPSINPEPPISAEVVVPILESIIDTEGNELVQVIMPKKWRVEKSAILTNFLRKFGRVLGSRNIKCSGYRCDKICEVGRTRMGGSLVCSDVANVNRYGMTTFACSKCDRKYCTECRDDELYNFCEMCEKIFCEDYCAEMNWCDGAEDCNARRTCRKCAPNALTSCDGCGEVEFCSDCEPEWIKCQYCDKKYCNIECLYNSNGLICEGEGCSRTNCREGCMDNNVEKAECVTRCLGSGHMEGCYDDYCTDCRVKMLEKKNWTNCCSFCKEDVAPVLAAQNKRLREEIEKLRLRSRVVVL